jgi:hypothetical protein
LELDVRLFLAVTINILRTTRILLAPESLADVAWKEETNRKPGETAAAPREGEPSSPIIISAGSDCCHPSIEPSISARTALEEKRRE